MEENAPDADVEDEVNGAAAAALEDEEASEGEAAAAAVAQGEATVQHPTTLDMQNRTYNTQTRNFLFHVLIQVDGMGTIWT